MVLDAMSKSYLQIKNKIYFYKFKNNTFQRMVYDLEKNSQEEDQKNEIEDKDEIIGIVFTEHDI